MTSGIELISNAFELKKVERIPWVPFVGSHAASLIGVNADEYLKSSELIIKGISKLLNLNTNKIH